MMNKETRARLFRQSPPSFLPRVGYGWTVSDVFGYGSVSRARRQGRNRLGSFHVAITQASPRSGIIVWVSEVRSSEADKGSRYLDYTRKVRGK